MFQINLLPPKMRKNNKFTKHKLGVIVLAEIFFIILLLYSYSCWQIAAITEQLHANQQELALLEPIENRKLMMEANQQQLLAKVHLIAKLNNDNNIYGILLSLGLAAPDRICLTQVTMQPNKQVLMHGYAINYQELGQFTMRLTEMGILKNIDLQSCSTVSNDQKWHGYLNFTLKAAGKG